MLQSIVSRNVHPQKTAVVSVTAVHGGKAFNVIPQEVEIQGTIRTFEPAVREMVLHNFYRIVEGTANSLGCTVEIDLQPLTPALVNNEQVTDIVQQTAKKLYPDAPVDTHFATMGSEDMAYFLKEIPGCFIFIGSANQQRGFAALHHHPKFDIDESVLPLATGLIASAAVELLAR
jgi:amidohydrolase